MHVNKTLSMQTSPAKRQEKLVESFFVICYVTWGASLVAQLVKNLPTMRETWVPCLGWDDPLEKGKATHSSILARRLP